MFLVVLIGKVSGMGKDLVLSYTYGVGEVTDAFFMANTLAALFYSAIFLAIPSMLIPIYTKHLEMKGGSVDVDFIQLIKSFITISFLLSMFIYFSSHALVTFFFPDLNFDIALLTSSYLRIISITFIISTAITILNTMQVVHGKRLLSYLVPLINNLFFIAGLLYFSSNNFESVLLFSVFGWFVLLVINVVVRRVNQESRVELGFSIKLLTSRKYLSIFIPLLLLFTSEQAISYITIYLSSLIGDGMVSVINYATKINLILVSLFLVLLNTYIFPKLSLMKGQGDKVFEKFASQGAGNIVAISSMFSIGMFAFSEPIVELLFERGAFTSTDTLLVASALEVISLSLPFFLLRDFFNRILFSLSSSMYSLISLLVTLLSHSLIGYYFMLSFGVEGVVVSLVVSSMINVVALYLFLYWKYDMNVFTGLYNILILLCIQVLAMTFIFQLKYEGQCGMILAFVFYGISCISITFIIFSTKINAVIKRLFVKYSI